MSGSFILVGGWGVISGCVIKSPLVASHLHSTLVHSYLFTLAMVTGLVSHLLFHTCYMVVGGQMESLNLFPKPIT
ncbi:hypothetical protein M6B38_102810 [Iris pallida]|uniref:Uncharacterized protein n=1 Tax=Iris pallida TaxID=29817 RepID=A0AAX6EB09_IRIPA|nr:hypothetical protein M6B38_199880 [Iris pallida]KAJ6824189.1 hypothetical protein M6B38_102810 [Iris pallida]